VQGRDANRLLQRVIKAEDKKKKLPKLIAKLRQQLTDWESPAVGNKPFVLGTVAYATEVLDVIEEELKFVNEIKPRKVQDPSLFLCRCPIPYPKKLLLPAVVVSSNNMQSGTARGAQAARHCWRQTAT
jgi:hypothetical protein